MAGSPQNFILPTQMSNEDMLASMGGFRPGDMNFALAGQDPMPSLQTAPQTMQLGGHAALNMAMDSCFEGPAGTAAPSNHLFGWPGGDQANYIVAGGQTEKTGTLKLEDIEAARPPQPPPTTAPSTQPAIQSQPTQVGDGKASGSSTTASGLAKPAQPAKPSQRKKRPSRSKALKSPEDHEKRRRFLERNRMAASKCRMRRKEELLELQEREGLLEKQCDELQKQVRDMHAEMTDLVKLVMSHEGCQDQRLIQWVRAYQAKAALHGQVPSPQGSRNVQTVNTDGLPDSSMFAPAASFAAAVVPIHQDVGQGLSMPDASMAGGEEMAATLMESMPTYMPAPITASNPLFLASSPMASHVSSPPGLEPSHGRNDSTSSDGSAYTISYVQLDELKLESNAATSNHSSFHGTPEVLSYSDFSEFSDGKAFAASPNVAESDSLYTTIIAGSPGPI